MNTLWIVLIVVLAVLLAMAIIYAKVKGGGQYTDLIQHQGKYLKLLPRSEDMTTLKGMFITDFDLTLTVRPAFIGDPRTSDYNNRLQALIRNSKVIFGGDSRIEMLNRYFKELKERRIEITVLTDNFKETIVPLLTRIGLIQYINGIIDFTTYFDEPKGVKVRNIMKPEVKCVFADDDFLKQRSVTVACAGKCICMSNIRYPLNEEGLQQIIETFQR